MGWKLGMGRKHYSALHLYMWVEYHDGIEAHKWLKAKYEMKNVNTTLTIILV